MTIQDGLFVVIDGADGAGKETQTRLLAQALRERAFPTSVFDFPRYEDSIFGRLIKEALAGEYGHFRELHPKLASLPFTLDRVMAKRSILHNLDYGIVIANRYVPSNLGYQAAKLDSAREQDEFVSFLEKVEYKVLGLPRPSIVFYLSVPSEVSRTLLRRRGRSEDQHERDILYQEKVSAMYRRLAEARPDWRIIECVSEGTMLSRGEIHGRVLRELEKGK